MIRFTIRDVLWLIVVVGMGIGWWLNWRAWNQHRMEHATELYRLETMNITLQDKLDGVHGFVPE